MKHLVEYLNEGKDISQYPQLTQLIYNVLTKLVGKTLKVNMSLGEDKVGETPISLTGDFKKNAISRSMGHILEGYVLSYLAAWESPNDWNEKFIVTQTNNDVYDADVEFFSAVDSHLNGVTGMEVKAFTGKTHNINFTDAQRTKLTDKDILYVFVKYTNTDSLIKIEKIYVGTYDDVSNGKSSISRHGSVRNMVSA